MYNLLLQNQLVLSLVCGISLSYGEKDMATMGHTVETGLHNLIIEYDSLQIVTALQDVFVNLFVVGLVVEDSCHTSGLAPTKLEQVNFHVLFRSKK